MMSMKGGSLDTATLASGLAILIVLVYLAETIYTAYLGPLSRFPGPWLAKLSRLPAIRSTVSGRDAEILPELHRKYGPIVRIGPKDLSFSGGARAWNDIYGFKKANSPKPYKSPKMYTKAYNKVDSIITGDDKNHSRQRKILSHAFSDRALKEQEPMLKRWSLKMKSKLAERAAAGENVDLLKFYNCTTFDIMGELTFSEGLDMLEDSEYSPWVKTIFESIKAATFLREFKTINIFTWWITDNILLNSDVMRRKQYEHFNYSKQRVDRRLQRTPESPDLWTKILEKSKGPDGLTIPEHHANASVMMIAGTETTATALSGTTYYLLRNPDKMQKLSREIREAFSNSDELNLESLAKIKYLQACLQEGLRMYPPVPSTLSRMTPKGGSIICGEFVPEGISVGVHHYSTYRSEDHFKNPNEYHPERWLGDPEYEGDHLDAVEVFSTGPRNCLGKNLAWHEMRILMATMVLHFDISLTKECEHWNNQKVFTLWEKVPLMCTLTPCM